MDETTGSVTAPPQPPPAPPSAPPIPPGSEDDGHGERHGGATAGIVLILVGVGLLLARTVPGVSWWMLWPLFVIVPGLVQCFSPGKEGWSVYRFFDGLVTVVIGLVLLANTTGYLSWSVWWEVLQLWPVLLISAGLNILGKALSQSWLRILGTLVVLGAFALAAASSFAGTEFKVVSGSGRGEPFSFREPYVGETSAELDLEAGVGEIRIDSGGDLVAIDGRSPFGPPVFSVTRSGSEASAEFSLAKGEISVYPGAGESRVDVELSKQTTWDIVVDSGVSALEADLSDIPVSSMTLKTGVSSNRVTLGDVPVGQREARFAVTTGVSSVTVRLPEGVEARVESQSGLTGHDIDPALSRVEGGWQTAGYEAARTSGEGVWIITVRSGLGSVAVDTY